MNSIEDVLFRHVQNLFPLFRSITGNGLRSTLRYIQDAGLDLRMTEVASGTRVLDWQVPDEWTPHGASITTLGGDTVVNVADHNLHLLQYSQQIDEVVSREELDSHLHSLPEQPDLIPYRTAYYARTWGFCLPHRLRARLTEPAYRVTIDADLQPGSLTYGEAVVPATGPSAGEVLFSVHCCHPSLANDNLSAIAVAIELARSLAGRAQRRFEYRFVFAPGTIGAICWLAHNRDAAKRIRHGLVLSCLGDAGRLSYKRSRRETAPIDRYAAAVLNDMGAGDRIRPFVPYGYDERQYCSPGFDLPVGCLMRSPNGTFPEYHTSADNLAFVVPAALADSLAALGRIVDFIEDDVVLLNTNPYGEPQLGRRGLYSAIGGQQGTEGAVFDALSLLWVLNQSDGRHTLLDIAERSGKPFAEIRAAADALGKAGLVRPVSDAAEAIA